MPNLIYPKVPTALLMADYVITKANQLHQPVTNLKLNKLLYLLNRQSLLTNQASLFDEPLKTGLYGPNVASVYGEYKKYGGGLITKPDRHLLDVTDNGLIFSPVFDVNQVTQTDRTFVDTYLPNWVSYDQFDLVKLVKTITEIK